MKLFEPGNIGVMKVKNRIVMAPMGLGAMAEADANWTERVREFYIARARGGVGLITTGLVFVSSKLEPAAARIHLNLYSDSHLDSLHRMVEGVHKYGAKESSPGRPRHLLADAKASSSQKGGRGRRLLCGGFAYTNRRMTMNKNIAVEGG